MDVGVINSNMSSPIGNFLQYFSLLSNLLFTRHKDSKKSLTNTLNALKNSRPQKWNSISSLEHPEDRVASERIRNWERIIDTLAEIMPQKGLSFFPGFFESDKKKGAVDFYFFTNKSSPMEFQMVSTSNSTQVDISNIAFNSGCPFKVIIHGFLQNHLSKFSVDVKNAYLESTEEDLNVIVIDWSENGQTYEDLSSAQQYKIAAKRVPQVGRRVAGFLKGLKKLGIIQDWASVHLIGFSLGAHICGNVGYLLGGLEGEVPGRISGLDPAGPKFLTAPSEVRLDEFDATFVDIVHTNMGSLGTSDPSGHANFYPNGGSHQPSCPLSESPSIFISDEISDLFGGTCSHRKSYEYFVFSIKERDIKACKCESWSAFKAYCEPACPEFTYFGDNSSQKARGRYYLDLELK